MPTIITAIAPDATTDYSFSLGIANTTSTQFGWSYSPKVGGFALAPEDALMPMMRDRDPHRANVRHGFIPATIEPSFVGEYEVYIHPAIPDAGSPAPPASALQPIQPPFPIMMNSLSPNQFNIAITTVR